jgi:hypothetical protein
MSNVEVYQRKLPSLNDIYADVDGTTKNTALAVILNAEPPQNWIKVHPMTKFKYIPIERVEYLLTRIFGRWKVEIKESGILANSVQVIIRLHYIDPVTGEWDWQDGIGASPLQTNAGAGAIDFNQIKNAAVQMASPAAESYAIKDAAEKLGKIFGKDLNRKDEINYQDLNENNSKRFKELERVQVMIEDAKNVTELENLRKYVTDDTNNQFTLKYKEVLNAK